MVQTLLRQRVPLQERDARGALRVDQTQVVVDDGRLVVGVEGLAVIVDRQFKVEVPVPGIDIAKAGVDLSGWGTSLRLLEVHSRLREVAQFVQGPPQRKMGR